jgi:hypothetical protein
LATAKKARSSRTHSNHQVGVTLGIYNNTALAGQPVLLEILPELSHTFAEQIGKAFSAEFSGTLAAPGSGGSLRFDCTFLGVSLAFLHVDDHLVCQTGANSPSGDVTSLDNPVRVLSKLALPVRLAVYDNASWSAATQQPVNITVRIVAETESVALTPSLPPAELQRRSMQQRLAQGWGLWYQMSFLHCVLLPEGQVVAVVLCDLTAQSCVRSARIDQASRGSAADIRLNEHAVDRSYAQLFLKHTSCNVSVAVSGGDELLAAVDPVDGCEDHAVVVRGLAAWYRVTHIWRDTPQSLALQSLGLRGISLSSTVAHNESLPLPLDLQQDPHLALALAGNTSIGLSTKGQLSFGQIAVLLEQARLRELATYAKFGSLAETKMAVQAAVMWTSVYNPIEHGPMANIIRGNPFSLDVGFVNDDWAYVIFAWDNIFASYMLSFDSRELGYSALIQVIKAKTTDGYISNWATPQHKREWSQPPLGSKVLLEMYKKYSDKWIVELLFDDLLDWNNWFVAQRRLAPLNLTCLGGPYMQAARWESGLDNSPMYDDGNWGTGDSEFVNGCMQLYDIGMASMHTMDSDALAQLARAIGRPEASLLQERADAMRKLVGGHLWDNESGIYANLFPNGSFSRRYSPTSFYALQTRAPSEKQVEIMMERWLLNPKHFCITPSGDFTGNTDDCYWGLPSISADDPAFPKLGYWRGYVWGPMAMLTYWGLQEYDSVPAARQARRGLASQMQQLMLSQYRAHRHICENFGPHRDSQECTGMHFYHWGALAGFLSILEAGIYRSSAATDVLLAV